MIDQYGEYLTGDLEEYYHRSIVDAVSGDSSPRYWLSLINHLPNGSRFVSQVRGGSEFRDWTIQTYLLAGVLDMVQAVDFHVARSYGGKRVKPPKPTWRPDTEIKRRQNNPFAVALRKKKELLNGSRG